MYVFYIDVKNIHYYVQHVCPLFFAAVWLASASAGLCEAGLELGGADADGPGTGGEHWRLGDYSYIILLS